MLGYAARVLAAAAAAIVVGYAAHLVVKCIRSSNMIECMASTAYSEFAEIVRDIASALGSRGGGGGGEVLIEGV